MKLQYDTEALRNFCRQRGIARLEMFGSVLREDDFQEDSDVDLLATLRPDREITCGLLEWVEMKLKLEEIFKRPVDLVSRPAIEHSRNPYRKASILAHTEPVYVEG